MLSLSTGFFSLFRDFLLRQASEQRSLGLVHAAKTNQLSRVREILDTQPEVVYLCYIV